MTDTNSQVAYRSEIFSHAQMCNREDRNLQQGMNFQSEREHSIILMSLRPSAYYEDAFDEDAGIIIYEGHDVPRKIGTNPKQLDQSLSSRWGSANENGRFFCAAKAFANGTGSPRTVRVYEKLKPNIWSYNGVFHLVDAWELNTSERKVFKFKLVSYFDESDLKQLSERELSHRRLIPSHVKLEVFKRDNGVCVLCGARDNLHYDHDFPYSLGGSSITANNIQLLCARHNLQKSNKVE